jgi:hypothetical protein
MAEIDSLEIQIQAKATKANNAIDKLITKLDTLSTSLSRINSGSLTGLSNGVDRLAKSMQSMNNVKTADFTRLAKGIEKLSTIDTASMNRAASSMNQLSKAFGNIQASSGAYTQISELAKGISQLGYKSSTKAIENIPKLATAMNSLMTTLSKAPTVNRNIIDMTNALAKLARTGTSSGRAANSLASSLNIFSKSAKTAKTSSFSLASAFGKLYASYWLIFRAFGKIRDAIDISSSLTEVENVVRTTFGNYEKLIQDFSKTSIQDFGMSELMAKQVASRFQAMGVAMGFSQKNMANMSLELTKLTADMASFYDMSQTDVARNLQAIFTGETEPLRKYGLDLTQATLKEWALKQGLDADITSMTQAQKAMLRYQYVMQNTAAAQGDFARTADTWHNQITVLTQSFQQLASIIGGALINAFKPFIRTLNQVMVHVISFAETVTNALGSIFGWQYEVSAGGVAEDWADGMGDFSDATGDAADNAKKLKTNLLGIDELNVVSEDKDNKGSGGSAGAGRVDKTQGGLVQVDTIFKGYESGIKSLEGLGKTINAALNKAMDNVDWNKIYKKADNFGKGLANFLNGLISPRLFSNVGKTIANSLNTALHFLDSFGTTFDWKNFGESIAEGVNSFFRNFDFGLLAHTINTWANGLLDTMITFLKKVKWSYIGYKIGDFISKIDFKGILSRVGQVIWQAINAGIETYIGIFSAAPIETAITTSVLLLKFTGLGASIAEKLKSVINTAIASVLESGITWSIAIPLSITLLANKLDSTFIDLELAKFGEEQSKKYGDTFNNIAEKAKNLTDRIRETNEAFREQINTKDENILFLETLADKYGTLSSKTNLTADEQKLLTQYTQELISKMPELNEYYDSENEKLTITTDKLKELITQKEKQIRLEAISEQWKETLKQEAEAQMQVKENAQNLSKAQEDLAYWTGICNDELEKSGGNANLAPYQDEVSKASQAVEEFSNVLKENKQQLDLISEQSSFYEEMYNSISIGAEEAKTTARTNGQNVASEYASGISDNASMSTEEIDAMVNDATTQLESINNTAYDSGKNMVSEYSQGAKDESNSTDYSELGENIVAGITEPMGDSNSELTIGDVVSRFFDKFVGKIKDVFGIHSPAEEMKPLGENIFLGIIEGFTSLFDTFTEKINEFWENYVLPWFTVEKWTELLGNILVAAQTKWDEIVEWWNGTALVTWWEESVVPWFSLEKWLEVLNNVKESFNTKWTETSTQWVANLTKWWTVNVAPWFTKKKWDDMLAKVPTAFKDAFKAAANGAIGFLNGVIEGVESLVNRAIDGLKKLAEAASKIPGVSFSIDIPNVSLPRIPKFSTGGFPEDGLFMANHNELVGQFSNGKTAVASNEMIVAGIEEAAYRGFSRAYEDNSREANLLSEILDAVREGKEISIDGRSLVSAVEERSNRNGFSFA